MLSRQASPNCGTNTSSFGHLSLHQNLQHISQPFSLSALLQRQGGERTASTKEAEKLKQVAAVQTSVPNSHVPVTLLSLLSTKASCSFECSRMVMKHLVEIDFFVSPGCGLLETGVISYAWLEGSHPLISRPLVSSSHLHYWFKRVCPAITALT